MPIKVEGVSPLLEVFDMPTSLALYRDKLGLRVTENPIKKSRVYKP